MICTLLNTIQVSEAALVSFGVMMAQPKEKRPVLKMHILLSSTVVNQLIDKDRINGKIYNEIAAAMAKMGGLG